MPSISPEVEVDDGVVEELLRLQAVQILGCNLHSTPHAVLGVDKTEALDNWQECGKEP